MASSAATVIHDGVQRVSSRVRTKEVVQYASHTLSMHTCNKVGMAIDTQDTSLEITITLWPNGVENLTGYVFSVGKVGLKMTKVQMRQVLLSRTKR